MASEKQTSANQRNAAKSTGPRKDRGISRQNDNTRRIDENSRSAREMRPNSISVHLSSLAYL
jgi:hypothetical protein